MVKRSRVRIVKIVNRAIGNQASIIMILSLATLASGEEVLKWQDCVREAARNNPDLIYAEENVNQQKAGKTITTSGVFPQIEASADATRKKTTTKSAAGRRTSTTANTYSYGVSGTQLIFDGFKKINDINAASENVKAAQQNYRFASSEVRLNLRTAFIDLLKSEELAKVTDEIVKIRKNSMELIALRYKSGLEHKGAFLTAEANVAEAMFEFSQAKRDIELSQRRLTKEMGREEFKPIFAEGDFVVIEHAREKPDFEEIAKTNPSILEAIAGRREALFNLRSAYGNFLPEVSGSAGVDRAGDTWPPENHNWDIGASVTLPLFEGGLKVAQVSQTKAAYRQAQAHERSVRYAAIVALEQMWAELQDAVETVEVKSKSLEAAKERSSIAEAQYSTGFITFDNWIIIENDLVLAKKAYIEAQANALLSEARWIQAKGETLEYAK